MTCCQPGCNQPAMYRTIGDLIGMLCPVHMELLCDQIGPQALVSLPSKEPVSA